jgi:hypothetical protein
MNSLTANPTAAAITARHLISERVADAEARAEARSARAARRRSRRPGRSAGTYASPPWAIRFLTPLH